MKVMKVLKQVSSGVALEDNVKGNFKTDVQQFDSSYVKSDAVQRQTSKGWVSDFIQIIKKKYETEKKPLSILDYCCGHGKPTIDIVNQLLKNNVGIEKVKGYDISKENIQYAQKINPYDFASFSIKNLDKDFHEVQEYDVIVSIYGLHWMNDTKSAIENIYRSLKPDGIILFAISLENLDQFDLRQRFISSPRWREDFNPSQFQLPKFHEYSDTYRDEFKKYFEYLRDQVVVLNLEWNKEEFKVCMRSYIPEIRHLVFGQKSSLKKEILTEAFLNQLYESIPEGLDREELNKKGGRIFYSRKVLVFGGKKLKNQVKCKKTNPQI